MKFNFDTTTADQTRLPEGAYEAEIIEADEVTSKSGTSGMRIKFTVAHNSRNVTVYDNLWCTPKAMPVVQQRLAAAGLPHNNEVDIAPHALIGRRVVITIRHEEYNGETRDRVYNWAPADPSTTPAPVAGVVDDDIPF